MRKPVGCRGDAPEPRNPPATFHILMVWSRVYPFLLYAYPPTFRHAFAVEMTQIECDQRRALEDAPWSSVLAHMLTVLADIMTTAGRQHLESANEWLSTVGANRNVRLVGRVTGSVLFGLAGIQVVYDAYVPTLSMGIAAWLMTLMTGLAGAWLLRAARPARGA